MITTKTYFPIIKTRDAELRGLSQLSLETKSGIVPLFELTRSRMTKKDPDGRVQKRLQKIGDDYGKNNPLALDLTSFDDLMNKEIYGYYDASEGFQKWTQFVASQIRTFPIIYPALIISDFGIKAGEEKEYIKRHRDEIAALLKSSNRIIYRVSGDYKALEFDIKNFFDGLSRPIVLLDMGYISQNRGKAYAAAAKQALDTINKFEISEVILAGSSYPSYPTENGEDESGENPLVEVEMYNTCKATYPNIIYGDYATIYPLPNERSGVRGWIPRIDFPKVDSTSIIYHRSRKNKLELSYKDAYIRTAQKVVKDSRFRPLQKRLGDTNWGIKQILLAAEGYPQGMSPSFWISVRINLHVTLRHLVLKNV